MIERRRMAMFQVTPDFLLGWMESQSDFQVRYPGADHTAVHYDFDSDCFWFKFRHPSLPEVADGDRLPFVEAPVFKEIA